jgi:flavodoxin
MQSLIVYDSVYGNTEMVAHAIGGAIGKALGMPEAVTLLRVNDATADQLTGYDLLVVGAPTHGFRPTPATRTLLKGLRAHSLDVVKVAAFDTRITQEKIDEVKILGFFVKFFGFAAEPIGKSLEKAGGTLAVPPEGFYVLDTEGPLGKDELQRAADWGAKIVAAL